MELVSFYYIYCILESIKRSSCYVTAVIQIYLVKVFVHLQWTAFDKFPLPKLELIILNNFVGHSLCFPFAPSVQQILTGYRVGTVDAMAYDWTSKVLFWTTSSYRAVVAFKVTDKSRRDIVTGLRNPKGIAVHPSAG